MRLALLGRSALGSSLAAAMLTGCGGPQSLTIAPNGLPQSRTIALNRTIAHDIGNASSSYRVLYSFGDGSDGQHPDASLIDVKGTFYGTTEGGGAHSLGAVFSISTTGTEHVLHSFGNTDGAFPQAGLVDVDGTLYGTTNAGGQYTVGTAFSISTTGTEKVLHSFGHYTYSYSDGAFPEATLIDVKGTLYGTTAEGGTHEGKGTVFSISTSGAEHVLHSFGYDTDGAYPRASLANVNGTFYGTTQNGGSDGQGTAFSISTTGTEHVLHSFDYAYDGAEPLASLIEVKGTLYGTTSGGPYTEGTVFGISTTGTEHVLHTYGYP